MPKIDRIIIGAAGIPEHEQQWANVLYYKFDGQIAGEIDFLGYDLSTNTMHVYEMKSKISPKSVNKAGNQLERARQYMKKYDVKIKTYLVIE